MSKKQLKQKNLTLSRQLRNSGRLNQELEMLFNSLSLEEVIALKLELVCRMLKGKIYFPLYKVLNKVVKTSVIKFTLANSKTNKEAAMILGLKLDNYKKIKKRFIENEFCTKL